MMSFPAAIKSCYKKYSTFSGRATRSEYWWFFLFYAATVVVRDMFQHLGDQKDSPLQVFGLLGAILCSLLNISALLPLNAVQVRRLHDAGQSGWWTGLVFVLSAIGVILCLISVVVSMAFNWPVNGPAVNSTLSGLAGGMGLPAAAGDLHWLIPGIGLIVLSGILTVVIWYFLVQPSQDGDNRYGPEPLN
jgi:uncharacterized membrane protein YhaH (DUF805 family)